jgi:integrase
MNERNITRRGSTYQVVVRAGVDPATGKRKRIRRTERTLKAARLTRDRLLVQLADGIAADAGSITVAGYVRDRWIPHMRTRVRENTADGYAQRLEAHVLPEIGTMRLRQVRPHHVQQVTDQMLAEGLSARTALHTYRVLFAALRQAVRWQLLPTNAAEGAAPPRAQRAELVTPSAEQTAAILQVAADRDGGRYAVPIAVAAMTGLRLGEVLALRWDSIDLDAEAGALSVVGSLQPVGRELRVLDPKTPRSRRRVPIPPALVATLRRHRLEQAERRLLLGEAWRDRGLVCDRGDGTWIRPTTLSHAFSRYATVAEAAGVRFHDLRHGYATRLLERAVHPKVVADLLGHSSAAFTMDTYAHVTPSLGEHAAAVIEAALGGE